MSDVIVAPETRDLREMASVVADWLLARLPGAEGLEISDLSYPRGAGQSHETILFDACWREGSVPHRKGCVVRIKPRGFTVFPDDLFDQQYRVMKALAELGGKDSDDDAVRVARPLWFEDDPGVLGNPFFVMERKTGRVPVSIPPYAREGWLKDATPDQRRVLWRNAVRQLAAIQRVPTEGLDFLAGPDGERGLEQEWGKYRRFARWLQDVEPLPVLTAALDRLQSLWPANQPEGLVWGDARIGNMMFDDKFDVVAVMDWEQPSLGGALHDLAWFCVLSETMHGRGATYGAPLDGMGSREETVALWEELTGKSSADLEWYEDFANFKMTCTGIRLAHLRGTPGPDEAAMARRLKVA
ncbi:phosphotransferase family protein [Novosphingobium sp.]|uniref:phosphotransferase family protein n=1 Tax=Novosphingobium sp. TaxID=1874826 RepID=UPI0028ACC075|nr:phosphotransferase family protein [Novosphingobium sp.]